MFKLPTDKDGIGRNVRNAENENNNEYVKICNGDISVCIPYSVVSDLSFFQSAKKYDGNIIKLDIPNDLLFQLSQYYNNKQWMDDSITELEIQSILRLWYVLDYLMDLRHPLIYVLSKFYQDSLINCETIETGLGTWSQSYSRGFTSSLNHLFQLKILYILRTLQIIPYMDYLCETARLELYCTIVDRLFRYLGNYSDRTSVLLWPIQWVMDIFHNIYPYNTDYKWVINKSNSILETIRCDYPGSGSDYNKFTFISGSYMYHIISGELTPNDIDIFTDNSYSIRVHMMEHYERINENTFNVNGESIQITKNWESPADTLYGFDRDYTQVVFWEGEIYITPFALRSWIYHQWIRLYRPTKIERIKRSKIDGFIPVFPQEEDNFNHYKYYRRGLKEYDKPNDYLCFHQDDLDFCKYVHSVFYCSVDIDRNITFIEFSAMDAHRAKNYVSDDYDLDREFRVECYDYLFNSELTLFDLNFFENIGRIDALVVLGVYNQKRKSSMNGDNFISEISLEHFVPMEMCSDTNYELRIDNIKDFGDTII